MPNFKCRSLPSTVAVSLPIRLEPVWDWGFLRKVSLLIHYRCLSLPSRDQGLWYPLTFQDWQATCDLFIRIKGFHMAGLGWTIWSDISPFEKNSPHSSFGASITIFRISSMGRYSQTYLEVKWRPKTTIWPYTNHLSKYRLRFRASISSHTCLPVSWLSHQRRHLFIQF